MPAPSVSREFTQAIFVYLAECGFSKAQVARCAAIDANRLLVAGRVPLYRYEQLFEAGASLTGDRYFGLNMGARPYPRSWGLVSHLAASAPDALSAATALMNYSELQLNFLHFELQLSESKEVIMEWRHDAVPRLNRHVAEHLLANISVLASTQIGYAVPGQRVELMHDNPGDDGYLSRMLNAEVLFNCDAYRIYVAPEFLQQQALYGEEDLYRITEDLARQRLGELRGQDRFLNQLRETVLRQLPGGLPKVSDVASSLELSTRTLQRRLKERNLRYQQVLDEVRRELAHQLIHEQGLDLKDLAHYLGFNDQSAFQHAFRRWEGMTPGQYRRRQDQSKRRD